MSDMDSASEFCEIQQNFNDTANNALSEESRKKYENVYHDFMEWKRWKNSEDDSFSKHTVLSYFEYMSQKFKPATLWTFYSMIKNMLINKHKVDISKYFEVTAFLRHLSMGYQAKAIKSFSPEETNKFLNDAPDEVYLLSKVALIFAIMGACGRKELHGIKFRDIQVFDSTIIVSVGNTKRRTDRIFTITGKYTKYVKKYISLRPPDCSEPGFFLQYSAGKCSRQMIGINKFGSFCKTIADFLNLPDPELYTGHCFRRTSASHYTNGNRLRKCSKIPKSSIHQRSDASQQITDDTSCAQTEIQIKDLINDKCESGTIVTAEEILFNEESQEVPCNQIKELTGNQNPDTKFFFEDQEDDVMYNCDSCQATIQGARDVCAACLHDLCAACRGAPAHAAHYVLRVPAGRTLGEVCQVLDKLQRAIQEAGDRQTITRDIKIEIEDCEVGENSVNQETQSDTDSNLEVSITSPAHFSYKLDQPNNPPKKSALCRAGKTLLHHSPSHLNADSLTNNYSKTVSKNETNNIETVPHTNDKRKSDNHSRTKRQRIESSGNGGDEWKITEFGPTKNIDDSRPTSFAKVESNVATTDVSGQVGPWSPG